MLIEHNILMKELHQFWYQQIQKEFPNIDFSQSSDYLCLIQYIDKAPQKFYSKQAFEWYFNFLEKIKCENQKSLIEILDSSESLLSIANKILTDINIKPIHDVHIPSDSNDLISFIDKEIHYNLLKIYETPLYQFGYILAKYSWIKQNKKTDGLDLYNTVQELIKMGFDLLADVYLHDVRNGIAHGKIVFSDYKTTYFDKKGNEAKVTPREIIKAFDDILDITNGFCLAFKMFCLSNAQFFEKNRLNIPQSILLEELQAKANSPGWKITNCLESQASNQRQLMIYGQNDNWDYAKVNWFCFTTAYWAEMLTKSYDRIFISFHSAHGKFKSGWAAYDGKRLRELRKKNETRFEAYKGVLEGDLLFFSPKFRFPRFIYKLGNIRSTFSVVFPLTVAQIRDKAFPSPYFAREAKMHSKRFFNVVEDTSLIVKPDFCIDLQKLIRKDKARIVKLATKFSRRNHKGLKLHLLPVRYVRVFVYDTDLRVRQLRNSGLIPELIATIEVNTSRNIKTIDIFEGVAEQLGKYRIVWNKKWLVKNDLAKDDVSSLPIEISIEGYDVRFDIKNLKAKGGK